MKSIVVAIVAFLGATSTSAFASKKSCSSLLKGKFGVAAKYRANELTSGLLKELIGTRISYFRKYAHKDPKDSRKVDGRGIVLSVELWANDQIRAFSIKLMNNKGERQELSISLEDPTFLLKVEQPSLLPSFLAQAQQEGKKTKVSEFYNYEPHLTEFYRDPNRQKLRILFVGKTSEKRIPFQLQQIESTATIVPSDQELKRNFLDHKPFKLEFQTALGPIVLNVVDIIAVAY